MSGSNPVEACLSYECRRRVSNKTSTSKPRPLHDFLEDAGGIFPFRSGLGLGTKSKSIFLSRNGFLQGKAWRVLGACRHGRDGEPFVVLLKAKSDSQLAILQHKELQSIGYVPLVGARGERDASGSPGLRYCCSQDLESVALWTSSSIQSYQESGAGGGRVLCKKYEVCSRAYLREENLIACDYSRDGLSLVALSHSEERGYSFKRYSLPGLDSQEIGPPHKGGIKGSEVAHASLSFGRGGAPQVCLATGDSRFCILDASLGVVFLRFYSPLSMAFSRTFFTLIVMGILGAYDKFHKDWAANFEPVGPSQRTIDICLLALYVVALLCSVINTGYDDLLHYSYRRIPDWYELELSSSFKTGYGTWYALSMAKLFCCSLIWALTSFELRPKQTP